jgi:hypothetical protein
MHRVADNRSRFVHDAGYSADGTKTVDACNLRLVVARKQNQKPVMHTRTMLFFVITKKFMRRHRLLLLLFF